MLSKLMSLFLLGLVRLLTGSQARWYGCPPKAEQRIYFANHQSHADLVMIWAALPQELRSITRPIAARDYWTKSPFRQWLTTAVFNAVYVDRVSGPPGQRPAPEAPPRPPPCRRRAGRPCRSPAEPGPPPLPAQPEPPAPGLLPAQGTLEGFLAQPAPAPAEPAIPPADPAQPVRPDPEALRAALPEGDPLAPLVHALESGDSIVIFPEGTRGHGDEPQPFKSGLYRLAQMFPHVVLVPAWIHNVQRVMPKGEVVPVPILCSVTFGAPIELGAGEERRAFLDRARRAVIALREV
ncbi:1-acyl-sn-glycerol-3-phosphate acyltransferase [Acidovorax citrulli]|nr:1-acyl-sn-glycerol-3-phosphate acyltransferase [Paracidovorax citrulli]